MPRQKWELAPGTGLLFFVNPDRKKPGKNHPDAYLIVRDQDGVERKYAAWMATHKTGHPKRTKYGGRYYRIRQTLPKYVREGTNPFEEMGIEDEADS